MIQIRVDHRLWLRKSQVNEAAIRGTLVWEEGKERRPLYTEEGEWLQVPRALAGLLREARVGVEIEDLRPQSYPRTQIKSRIKLDHITIPGEGLVPSGGVLQQQAFEALQSGVDGGLALYCGAGKTVIAAHHLAKLGRPALVVVDNVALLEQWQRECRNLLTYSPDQEGLWKGGREQWQRSLVFTTYQTLAARTPDLTDEQRRHFGLIIYDEGHHLGAETFHKTAGAFTGQRINLTATPERADGFDVITRWHIGPSLFTHLPSPLLTRNVLLKTGYYAVEGAQKAGNEEAHLARLSAAASCDVARVRKIVGYLRLREQVGRRQAVLTRSLTAMANLAAAYLGLPLPFQTPEEAERLDRVEILRSLTEQSDRVGLLFSEAGAANLIEYGARPMVFSIFHYLRDGFNQPALDTVVVDGPVTDPGLVQQIMGRPTRPHPNKPQPEFIVLLDGYPSHVKAGRRLARLLETWSESKGGPLTYEEEKL